MLAINHQSLRTRTNPNLPILRSSTTNERIRYTTQIKTKTIKKTETSVGTEKIPSTMMNKIIIKIEEE